MHMDEFSRVNENRCVKGFKHSIDSWTLSDWATATTGELGEACNIIKKLNRLRDNIQANKEKDKDYMVLKQKLKGEIADVFIYLDLLAKRAGFELQDAVIETFNAKSKELGFKEDNIEDDEYFL